MNPDELRALADALEPMAKAPRFEDFDVPAFCAWVRACADAKPVGEVTNLGGILSTPLPVGTKLYAHPAPAVPAIEERGPWSAGQDKQQPWEQRVWIESDDFTHDVRLYVNGNFESGDQRFAYAQEIARRLNAAPAAPQAEPFVPHARCKTPDKCRRDGVCFDAWACSSGPAPQAEPKREPLSDEPPRGFVRWVRNNMPPNTVISNPDWWAMQLWRAAMRAHRIGGSDAE